MDAISKKALLEMIEEEIESFEESSVDVDHQCARSYNLALRNEINSGRFDIPSTSAEERYRVALNAILQEAGYESDYPGAQINRIYDRAEQALSTPTKEASEQ